MSKKLPATIDTASLEPIPDETATEMLQPNTYKHLRNLAASHLRSERRNHTLQATEIAHEAWLRLASDVRSAGMEEGRFWAMCSIQIRRILIDHGRRRSMAGRHGYVGSLSADQLAEVAVAADDPLSALDEALTRLARKVLRLGPRSRA